jgi:uncharacterized membrane protein YqjE
VTEESSKSDNSRGTGLFDSFRELGATLVSILQTRLELLSTELEEEKVKLGWLMLLAGIALFFLGLGILLATLLIIIAFWEHHRLLVLAGLAGLYLILGVALWLTFLNKARGKPLLFATSLDELSKDRERLSNHS